MNSISIRGLVLFGGGGGGGVEEGKRIRLIGLLYLLKSVFTVKKVHRACQRASHIHRHGLSVSQSFTHCGDLPTAEGSGRT